METKAMLRGEWNAPVLRPVARWVSVTDEAGRRRLEMTWAVPEIDAAAMVRGTALSRT
jgi:hypothetical protein